MKQVSKISLVIMALMALTIALLRAQTIESSKVATTDPISTVGHGAILDSKGNEIDPSPEFVIDAQHFYLKRLFELADDKLRAEFKAKQQRLESIKGLTQQRADSTELCSDCLAD